MMIPLKYSTASQEIPLGYFVDSTDGNTEETGLTLANTDIKLWKNGATTLANKNSGGGTHISNGIYYAVLDATDTDTYGPLVIYVHVSGALAVKLECVVMNADAFDALYSATSGKIRANVTEISGDSAAADTLESYCDGTTPQPVNVTQISGDATAADNLESACDGTTYNIGGGAVVAASVTGAVGSVASGGITAASIAANAIDADAIAADAVTELQSGLATAAELAKVPKSDSTVSWNATALAAINAEVDAALNTAIPGSPVANSINERIATMDGLVLGTIAAGTHNPQSGDAYARLGAPAGASIAADLVVIDNFVDDLESRLTATRAGYLDQLEHIHTDTDGVNTKIDTIDGLIDTLISRLTAARAGYLDNLSAGAAALQSSVDELEGRLTAARAGYLDNLNTGVPVASIASGAITAAAIATGAIDADALAADAVAELADGLWDEAISGHLGAGTTGAALNAAGSAGDPWSTPIPGAYGAGTAGKIVGDNLNAPVGTIDTVADAIKAVTDKLDTAMELDGAVYRYTTNALEQAPTGGSAPTAVQIRQEIDSNSTQLAAIVADTAEIQAELADGGRTDLLIDGIKAKTDNLPADPADDSDIDAQLATIDGNVDTLISRIVGTLASGTHNAQSGDAYARLGAPVGASISADLVTIDGIVDTIVARVIGTLAAGTHNAQSGDAYARLGVPAGASVSADVAAVKAETASILTDTGTTLDGKLDTIDGIVDSILADTGTDGVKVANTETGLTFAHAMQIIVALACKMSGGGTSSIVARDYADAKNRVTWTVDENGNRTAVTFNFD